MSKNDRRVHDLIEIIKKKRKELGAKPPRFVPLTNAKLMVGDDNNYINLHVETDLAKFASVLAMLLEREAHYADACLRLNIKAPFTWHGYSIEDWETDIKTRVKIIQWRAKNRELENLEHRLSSMFSSDAQTSRALDEIAAQLGQNEG